MINNIVSNLKQFFLKSGKQKAVLGLSGGIDSALTAKIAVMALGAENVTALILPNNNLNQSEEVTDALNFAKDLGIKFEVIAIDEFVSKFSELPWEASKIANMNIQSRARACILYHYANSHDALVLGTSNKTELALGYFTKFGDGACDCEVIGSLYKTEVWESAKELGLPEKIISKSPSAQLADGQTDEAEIGVSYAEIDEILKKFEQGKEPETNNEKLIWNRINANKHKGEVPPTI
ncbi:NAD+ synthase [Candidatus Peregrinibacteria bacterium]|nr:NAD+ synthase [Candidatus Peregrinibacteria bacterium]